MKIKAHIKGVGGYVPPKVLSNKDLEGMVETSDEWILERTGIAERRILENDGTSKICIEAFKDLQKKVEVNVEEIDLVIACTSTPDYKVSALAPFLAREIGAVNAFSYDLGAACSGFIYGISTASSFIESGKYKKILVFGADKMSSVVNYNDRNTCIIFGDGGGVVLLEPGSPQYGICDEFLGTEGIGHKYLNVEYGGSKYYITKDNITENRHYLFQDGKVVFKNAVYRMVESLKILMQKSNLDIEDIDWFLPHQANKRIIDIVAREIKIDSKKVLINIEKYGNTTNGTIPLLLYDFESKLKKGDNLLVVTFGAGFTWGAQYIRWAYDSK